MIVRPVGENEMIAGHKTLATAFHLLALASLFAPQIAQAGKYHVLYRFTGGDNAESPDSGLVRDDAGNLYGTTPFGGDNDGIEGIVYRLAPNGTETVLYNFDDYRNGDTPESALYRDSTTGDLYGTTFYGGIHNQGVIFKLTPDGTETVLHSFNGADSGDGAYPEAPLIRDKKGNFYSTASEGGTSKEGVVYKFAKDGTVTVLHSFSQTDGLFPASRLKMDKDGNLYGTAPRGGPSDNGVVFKVTPDGAFTLIHSFTGGKDGTGPVGGVVTDSEGNLYGATSNGADVSCFAGPPPGCGTVYKIAPDGKLTVLHTFHGGKDGEIPLAELFRSKSGTLYGTTAAGGDDNRDGTVFRIDPDGNYRIIHRFNNVDGSGPAGKLIEANGILYGTTSYGGNVGGAGVVFSLKE